MEYAVKVELSNFHIKCQCKSKAMTNTFFGTMLGGGGSEFLKLWWEAFFNKREYSVADWLDLLITKIC